MREESLPQRGSDERGRVSVGNKSKITNRRGEVYIGISKAERVKMRNLVVHCNATWKLCVGRNLIHRDVVAHWMSRHL